MAKFNENLRKLLSKLSIKYLLFIIIIIIGCSYQIIQLTQVFLKFETKVDVKFEQSNKIVVPMVSFCKLTEDMFRKSSKIHSSKGLSPAQLYNQTYNFAEVFIGIEFIRSNYTYHKIVSFTDEEQNNSEIYNEKTISDLMICYHIKYLHSKQLKHKQGEINTFQLYHPNYETSIPVFDSPYLLFFSSDINYPHYHTDNPVFISGKIFFCLKNNIKVIFNRWTCLCCEIHQDSDSYDAITL